MMCSDGERWRDWVVEVAVPAVKIYSSLLLCMVIWVSWMECCDFAETNDRMV
jgi:hypothetical protein